MGQGGYVDLINGTPYPWLRTAQSSYQMDSWSFPSTISPGKSVSVYVEWNQDVGNDEEDDAGEAVYSLNGTSATFQVQARNTDGFNIEVVLTAVETENNDLGSTIALGFNDDQSQNLATLGAKSLRHICMPGSHDAGMSEFGTHTAFAKDTNTLTQKFGIGKQLEAGSRWFDIRPVISSGTYYTGHYSDTGTFIGWQGANGQSLADIIDDINSFTAQYHELVILDISHSLDTDNDYAEFSQSQWNDLFEQFLDIDHRFNTSGISSTEDLSNRTLSSFIGNDAASVLIVIEVPSGITLGTYFDEGIVASDPNFPFYNVYADSDDLATMESDQLSKLATNRKTPDDTFFLLSWTLTESVEDAVGDDSILELASTAYQPLFESFGNFTAQSYPNVLYMDLFGTFDQDASSPTTDVAALALAVNGLSST